MSVLVRERRLGRMRRKVMVAGGRIRSHIVTVGRCGHRRRRPAISGLAIL
jgi:hypothetical protein